MDFSHYMSSILFYGCLKQLIVGSEKSQAIYILCCNQELICPIAYSSVIASLQKGSGAL